MQKNVEKPKNSLQCKEKSFHATCGEKMAKRDGFSTGFVFHRNSFPFKRKMWKKKVYELYKNGAGIPF